ncbi:hypothetical protein AG1IA_05275 [Rhizoctonia solani AG-1 IA]|uniref:Uncharacterized protein n=1 Tax=Thanatephorus cucumeris (strain AG1-IA) TaxID=983506 RepID=L8WV81_THACA|nr:hypothetical protein AG1IA_05275 [Rhizoctonia solani AG-1 IA]
MLILVAHFMAELVYSWARGMRIHPVNVAYFAGNPPAPPRPHPDPIPPPPRPPRVELIKEFGMLDVMDILSFKAVKLAGGIQSRGAHYGILVRTRMIELIDAFINIRMDVRHRLLTLGLFWRLILHTSGYSPLTSIRESKRQRRPKLYIGPIPELLSPCPTAMINRNQRKGQVYEPVAF